MLGDNIKKFRKEANLSQEALAEKIGVTRQSISLWENNRSQPSIEIVLLLSKALNKTTDELLLDVQNAPNAETQGKKPTPKKGIKPLYLVLALFIVAAIGVGCFFWLKPVPKDIPTKPFSEDTDAIATAEASVVKVYCFDHNGKEIATGSGVVMFHDDMIVTNYHVIEDVYSVKVSTDQDITYNVLGVWHKDENQDIAILKLEKSTGLSLLKPGKPSALQKGETVTAIGSPLGIKNTVSKGNLSARIMQSNYDILQFTAPISSGSSGGALFNEKGEVVGITYASFEEGQNLNLAIPIDLVEYLYQTKSISIEPDSFEDDYWTTYPEEFLELTYGKTISVSFAELKNNPEKYRNKMISVEAFVSSTEKIKNVRIGMYISSQKQKSDKEKDAELYKNKDFTEHDIIRLSYLKVGKKLYYIGKGDPQDKVSITGVFGVDASGNYEISVKTIKVL